ncbi:MAG TPA: helix-turn-helix transcriptional regulator [Ktedonobacteraceae bacterium]|nr:helix-turn-helix transcriptional regulator [Ktedonobacteraceae bacterium]
MSSTRKRKANQLLTDARLRRYWSQQEVANRVGTTPENVSRWERGVTMPGPHYRQKLCDVFGKSAQELGLVPVDKEELTEQSNAEEPTEQSNVESENLPPTPLAEPALPSGKRWRPRKLFQIGALLFISLIMLFGGAGVLLMMSHPSRISHASISHPISSPTPTLPRTWHQVINDPLNIHSHGDNWAIIDPGCTFRAEGYDQTSSTGSNYCNDGDSTVQSFHDLNYTIELSIRQGNRGGLIFRLRNHAYYYFSITLAGAYYLLRHETTDGGDDTIIASGSTSVIQKNPDQWNTLQVVAQNQAFQLWINRHYITTAHDNAYSQGTIGVAVSAGTSTLFTEVWFRHAQVWIP